VGSDPRLGTLNLHHHFFQKKKAKAHPAKKWGRALVKNYLENLSASAAISGTPSPVAWL
jgi:hypothetical protein